MQEVKERKLPIARGEYGLFFIFLKEYVCRLMRMKKLRKHLAMGGRKYNYKVTSFIVTGKAEAIGSEAVWCIR